MKSRPIVNYTRASRRTLNSYCNENHCVLVFHSFCGSASFISNLRTNCAMNLYTSTRARFCPTQTRLPIPNCDSSVSQDHSCNYMGSLTVVSSLDISFTASSSFSSENSHRDGRKLISFWAENFFTPVHRARANAHFGRLGDPVGADSHPALSWMAW